MTSNIDTFTIVPEVKANINKLTDVERNKIDEENESKIQQL